jgi:hypothetical protein
MSVYELMIKNLARHIRSWENRDAVENGKPHLNIFTASDVLSVALCKSKEEIAMDLAMIEIEEEK